MAKTLLLTTSIHWLLVCGTTGQLALPKERTTGLECVPEGKTVSYECTVNDPTGNGSTVWLGSAFNCSDSEIVLSHSAYSGVGVSGVCAGLSAQSVIVYGTEFISLTWATAAAPAQRGDALIVKPQPQLQTLSKSNLLIVNPAVRGDALMVESQTLSKSNLSIVSRAELYLLLTLLIIFIAIFVAFGKSIYKKRRVLNELQDDQVSNPTHDPETGEAVTTEHTTMLTEGVSVNSDPTVVEQKKEA